jgi:DNA-binding transcriptional regulator YdaS (Cro superfamily)
MNSLTKDQAIVLAGSAAALSRLLGISRSAITQWGYTVPDARVAQLKTLRPEWFEGGFTQVNESV